MLAIAFASRSSASSSASSAGPPDGSATEEERPYEITISASPGVDGRWRTSAVFAITAPSEVEAKEMLAVVDDTVQSFGGPRVRGRSRSSARSSGRRERWRPRGRRSFRSLAHHEGGPVKVRSSPRPSTARTTRCG